MAKNKLKCNVTGLWYGVSAARREKLIQKYGSFEELVANYVSRDAVRLQKDGKSVEEIRELVESGELTSNTAAPKRATTRGDEKAATKVAPTKEAEPEVTEDDDIDPDVKAFLEADEDEAPTADASDKAL